MKQQTTDTILLVRPTAFRRNEETAVNNFFQSEENSDSKATRLALAEFDNFVQKLQSKGIKTIVIEDDGTNNTPDSVFPNNVISFQEDTATLYPMFANNRRRERKLNYLGQLEKIGIKFDKLKDYSIYEDQDLFLEGTGVLILDHVNRLAYCSLSERAKPELLQIYCEDNKFVPIVFEAYQKFEEKLLPIYHSNVMMSLGKDFCVICLETIKDVDQKAFVIQNLKKTNKTIVEITEEQMNQFAGNILEVRSTSNQAFIVMSEQAYNAFTAEQIEVLSTFGEIIQTPLYTIEKYGGGSARCMMAEIFYR